MKGAGGFQSDTWDRVVWPQLVTLSRKVLQAVEDVPGTSPAKGVQSFELVGIDVLLDQDLKPWFLEANCSPDLCGDADPALRSDIQRCLKSALSLVKRSRDEKSNRWLPPAVVVDAASGGVPMPDADSWRLIKNSAY